MYKYTGPLSSHDRAVSNGRLVYSTLLYSTWALQDVHVIVLGISLWYNVTLQAIE